jgi:hypothetical protein
VEGKIIANNLTNGGESVALRAVLAQTFTTPTTPFKLALFTSDPTETGAAGTEVSGNAYARQTIAFTTESGGAASNSAQIDFPAATGSWGTITHIVIYDNAGTPVALWYAPLSSSVTIANTDIFRVNVGDISVSIN